MTLSRSSVTERHAPDKDRLAALSDLSGSTSSVQREQLRDARDLR